MRLDQLLYSTFNFNFHLQNIHKELNDLKQFLISNNIKAKSIIDIGCGDGYVTRELVDFLKIRNAYGLDINSRLLNEAQSRGVKTIHADIESYESNGSKYDLVIIYGTVHHIKDTKKLMIKAIKLCKSYILIVDSTVRNNFIHKILGSRYFLDASPYGIKTKEEIIQALKLGGCKIIDEKTNLYANFWHDRSFILAVAN